MEKYTPSGPEKKNTYESPLGSFEVVELQSITGKDVGPGDRAFIHTQSGNRYMVRHSRSQGGLAIYNEREGSFEGESGHRFMSRSQNFATVGQPLEYLALDNPDPQKGTVYHSTTVTSIEVRKGLEAAIREASSQVSGSGIARMMIDEVKGRGKPK